MNKFSCLHGNERYVACDDEVAYRNEQGNCIDSFRSNRQRVSITLWGCGSPVETSERLRSEAPTEPTGETTPIP